MVRLKQLLLALTRHILNSLNGTKNIRTVVLSNYGIATEISNSVL